MSLRGFAVALAVAAAVAAPARADEGMWTFDDIPVEAIQKADGVTLEPAWLDHVRLSAVRLTSGCSAAIVSGQGLMLTNYHCVADCVQSLSSAQQDFARDGFLTAATAEERRCPGLQAEVLVGMSDVTERMTGAGSGDTPAAALQQRFARTAELERQGCAGDPRLHCQVISLHRGGRYVLYRYRRYGDVRLAFAPELATGLFGGDPDNFNFPRYDLDIGFLRLYQAGRPAATPEHLAWNASPPKEGQAVFVAGNPGSTERELTVAQLEAERDIALPFSQLQRAELRGRLLRFAEESPEHARIAADPIFNLENAYKEFLGRQLTLDDPAFMDLKRKQEAALRASVRADPRLAGGGDLWAIFAALRPAYAALYAPYAQLEARAGSGSTLFAYARLLVRAAEERGKAPGERLPEYGDARLPLIEAGLMDARPVEPELERLYLEFWLSKTREALTVDDPDVKALLGHESPEALAARLAAGSKLADPAARRALWDGGLKAIRASDDPMIRFVLATDAQARAARRAWEQKVSGPTARAEEAIARARFTALGRGAYPDATFSLRLSYGRVAGWTENGRVIGPFTRFAGLYARATGADPFALAPRWVAARNRLDPETVFDFTTTNDIAGGNSGSPVIDAKGELIGAMFDGNIHSLGGEYGYDPALNRAVAVSAQAIAEALDKVYGQSRLLAELNGR